MVKNSQYSDLVIPELPLADFILQKVLQHGDDVALVDNYEKKAVTFHQIYNQSRQCASALYKMGLRKGDVVIMVAPNCIEYPVIVLGVVACGATLATCNSTYSKNEMMHQFQYSEPRVVFAGKEAIETTIYTIGEVEGFMSYDKLLKTGTESDFPKDLQIDVKEDVAILPYSSGTTGLPKGVMHTHNGFVATIIVFGFHMNMFRSNLGYMERPVYHAYGLTFLLICLTKGVKLVFDKKYNMKQMLEAIQEYKVTHILTTPSIVIDLAKTEATGKYETLSLKRIFCGGSTLPTHIIEKVEKEYKTIVSTAYGMSESTPISFCDPITNPSGSVGSICANTKIKIIDIQTGEELGPDKDGEILVKAPQVMKGYFRNLEATSNAFDVDGFLYTGDLGHYDKYGMMFVVDRMKEVIKCRGKQVPPAEVEAMLLRHPMIADAGVIGVPHPIDGEVPKAYIVKKNDALTEKEVEKFIEAELAYYKHLKGGVEFVDKIPKTASGKVQRNELRKLHKTR